MRGDWRGLVTSLGVKGEYSWVQDVEGGEGRVDWAGILLLELDTGSSAVDAGGGDCGFIAGREGGV